MVQVKNEQKAQNKKSEKRVKETNFQQGPLGIDTNDVWSTSVVIARDNEIWVKDDRGKWW